MTGVYAQFHGQLDGLVKLGLGGLEAKFDRLFGIIQ
jgi:hypothetical protein